MTRRPSIAEHVWVNLGALVGVVVAVVAHPGAGLFSIVVLGLWVALTWDAPGDVQVPLLLDVADTAPPQVTADGRAVCTGCGAAVPFADMALDERGYFCAPCTLARR